MKKITNWLNESIYTNPLSPACKMCARGSKMVVFITGLCLSGCFYCPLSKKKLRKDRIFADEWELKGEKDIEKLLLESEYIDATGAGITGGDPLIVWKRTMDYISLLKDEFGPDFHIHIYTSGIKYCEHIDELVSAGLDEIRFHPDPNYWDNMNKNIVADSVKTALETNVDVAIEIPSIPEMENEMFSLIHWADDVGVRYINLNELEYSETNAIKLNNKGFTVKDDISAAVKGSQEAAKKIVEKVANENFDLGIHYCSSSFKDGIQLRNRIKRRAKNIINEQDVMTDEGTLLKGIVHTYKISLEKLYNILTQEFQIDDEYVSLNRKKNRVELAVWKLEVFADILKKRGFECYMIEEYPTADRLEVERIPLPL
jgi:pyruvate formate-lyase activating enzyme-like uncharacterized protein